MCIDWLASQLLYISSKCCHKEVNIKITLVTRLENISMYCYSFVYSSQQTILDTLSMHRNLAQYNTVTISTLDYQ